MSKLCKNCGAQMADNAVFCTYCGTKEEGAAAEAPAAQEAAEKKFCTMCGKELLPGKAFCANCGASSDRAKALAAAAPPPVPPVQPTAYRAPAPPPAAGANFHTQTPAPPNYVNRTMPAYAAAQAQSAPKKKGHGCLIAFICVFLAIALLITGFVYPGFFVEKEEGGGYMDKWSELFGDLDDDIGGSNGKGSGKDSTLSIPAGKTEPVAFKDYTAYIPENAVEGGGEIKMEKKGKGIEISVEGQEYVRLNEPVTIMLELDKPVPESELPYYKAAYVFDGKQYFIDPDPNALVNGYMVFNTYHFSAYDPIKTDEQKIKERLAHEYAVKNVIVKARTNNNSETKSVVAKAFENLGIDSKTAGGKVYNQVLNDAGNYVGSINTDALRADDMQKAFGVNEYKANWYAEKNWGADKMYTQNKNQVTYYSGGNESYKKKVSMVKNAITAAQIANAAKNEDEATLIAMLTTTIMEGMQDKINFGPTGNYIAAGLGALPEAYTKAVYLGKYDEAAVIVAKAVAGAIPVVDKVKLAAELVSSAVNTWADSEMELAYKAWSGEAAKGEGGYSVKPDDWNTIKIQMRGAYTQYLLNFRKEYCATMGWKESELTDKRIQNLDSIAEKRLLEDFKARKAQSAPIEEAEAEYLRIVDSFEREGSIGSNFKVNNHLLTVGKADFDEGDDYEVRLNRLMNIRGNIIDMLGGEKKYKSTLNRVCDGNVDKENAEIASMIQQWLEAGGGWKGRKAVADRIERVYGLTDEKTAEKPKDDGALVWVLTETKVYDGYGGSYYDHEREATECVHKIKTSIPGKGADAGKSIYVTMTCTKPPTIIKPGQEFTLELTSKGSMDEDFPMNNTLDRVCHYGNVMTRYRNDVFSPTEEGAPRDLLYETMTSRGDYAKNVEYVKLKGKLELFKNSKEGNTEIIEFTAAGSVTAWKYTLQKAVGWQLLSVKSTPEKKQTLDDDELHYTYKADGSKHTFTAKTDYGDSAEFISAVTEPAEILSAGNLSLTASISVDNKAKDVDWEYVSEVTTSLVNTDKHEYTTYVATKNYRGIEQVPELTYTASLKEGYDGQTLEIHFRSWSFREVPNDIGDYDTQVFAECETVWTYKWGAIK